MKRENQQPQNKNKFWGGAKKAESEKKNQKPSSGQNAKNMKMVILRGKGQGDHGIVSKFYLIKEWKIQCEISRIKIHEESVKIKELEFF